MLRPVILCICDICGKSEPAVPTRPGMTPHLPNGWVPAWGNKQVHICPECNSKLRIGYKEGLK